jgi:hypothetical protein
LLPLILHDETSLSQARKKDASVANAPPKECPVT